MKTGAIVIVAAALIFAVIRARFTHFFCPKCHTRFKIGILSYIFALHFIGTRMATCPNCGNTELMTPEWDDRSK